MIDSLLEVPADEDELFEFKGSKESLDKLGGKVCKAASAFSNAGGGTILLGIDRDGSADGGIASSHGRTSIRDWIDQKLQFVQPAARYKIKTFSDSEGRGSIEEGKVVVAIEFYDSDAAPHMSDDHMYYIRTGAHSIPANSFLVEALLAKRGSRNPVLTHLFRRKPSNTNVIQLTLVTLTPAPAVDVVLEMNPMSEPLQKATEMFPLRIPVIDDSNPFAMDIDVDSRLYQSESKNTKLIVQYSGITGSSHKFERIVDIFESIPPIVIL